MLLAHELYYRKFGLRKIVQILNPPTFPVEYLSFPRNVTYHFVSHDSNITLPDPEDPLFKIYSKKIIVSHVSELLFEEGQPKHLNKMVKGLYREWQLQNNAHFRYTENPTVVASDPMSLSLYNYGLLNDLYRYLNTPIAELQKWVNIEKTMWATMSKDIEATRRQQFIIKDLPLILPAVSVLKNFSKENTASVAKRFITPESMFLLDIWRWLDQDFRAVSTIASLKDSDYPYINIILRYKNVFTVINLGYLDSWRKSSETNMGVAPVKVEDQQLQRFFLKLIMSIQTKAAVPDDIVESVQNVTEKVEEDDSDDSIASDYIAGAITNKDKAKIAKVSEISDQDLMAGTSETSIIDIQKEVDEDLQILEKTEEEPDDLPPEVVLDFNIEENEHESLRHEVLVDEDPYSRLEGVLLRQVKSGALTGQSYKTIKKQLEESQNLPSAYDKTKKMSEMAIITPEDTAIADSNIQMPDSQTIPDKTMLKTSLKSFDSQYVEKVLDKDVQANINHLIKAGVIVREHQIEIDKSAMGTYELHTLKIRPIDGVESTLHFRLPKIDQEGEFLVSGNKCRMRKQRTDLPIRKISPNSVALSSYYGKVFVNRSDRVQYNEQSWLSETIMNIGFSGSSDVITKIAPAMVFDNYFRSPYIYSTLAQKFKSIETKRYSFVFDHKERPRLVPEGMLERIEGKEYIVVGASKNGIPVVMDFNNRFYEYTDSEYKDIGTIYDLLGIDVQGSPLPFSEVKVFAKGIPLAVVMGYYIGLSKLIKLMRASVTVYDRNKRATLKPNEWRLVFRDKVLVLNRDQREATLALSGLNFFKDTLKNYDFEQFDRRDVYLLLLDQRGISARYLKEIDSLEYLFVDPITESILKEMKEPRTFKGLLLRSNELLLNDQYPDVGDMRHMRIRGYERVAGFMYNEMIKSIREYSAKNIRTKSQISMNPYAIWSAVTQDQTVKISEDINPINDLKEVESVTYVGADGRSKDAIMKEAREFNVTDIGVISEATVDSGDVAINTSLSANPKFSSVRGTISGFDIQQDGLTSMLSTSAMLAPFSTNDDHKRTNFVSIQNGHTVACEGYRQPQIRTGYESVMANRVGKLYAATAEDDGTVMEITDRAITVQYKNGNSSVINIGRQLGRCEGSLYPHDVITTLKKGDRFKKDDAIAYNKGFFEPDFLNPKRIIMKMSMMTKVAIMDTTQTIEDASSITPGLSSKLRSKVVKERVFVLAFNQSIRNAKERGAVLTPKDPLFIIEDAITSDLDVFDDNTIESLSRLSNLVPKAKVNGVLDRYEIYYNGDIDDMSASLKKLTLQSNKLLAESGIAKNGHVNEEYRVEGRPLQLDTLVLKVYIVVEDNAAIGDKGVFGNQLKTVISEVMSYPIKTESGEVIDAIFSYKSIGNRITLSPLLIGTSSILLDIIAKKAVGIYKS